MLIDRLKDGESGDVVDAAGAPLGMKVRELNSEMARQLHSQETSGVVVTELDDNGLAAEAGILLNDIVKEINGRKIASLDDYNKAIAAHKKGDFVRILVRRGDALLYIAAKLE